MTHRTTSQALTSRTMASWSMRARALAAGLALTTVNVSAAELDVSPQGDDANPGSAQQPLASLAGAKAAVRKLLAKGVQEDITVRFHGGTYALHAPVTFGPEDSARGKQVITYAAAADETPVFSGGRRITGWQAHGSIWTTALPEVKNGTWAFRCLYVNDARRTLARIPNAGEFFRMADTGPTKNSTFKFTSGHLRNWPDTAQGNIVGLAAWESYILPLTSIDEATGLVTVKGKTRWEFKSGQRYFVENIAEALDAPGEWYLDRAAGVVSYIPNLGENMADIEVVAPLTKDFVIVAGTPDQTVQSLVFTGLHFRHADYELEADGHADIQGAHTVSATMRFSHALNCRVENGELAQTGLYGIEIGAGCRGIRIEKNELHDLGAGAVTVRADSSGTVIHNNFIHNTGCVYYGSSAILMQDSGDNVISHNEICDTNWMGICLGWSWGFQPSRAHNNLVEFNYLHHLGRGMTTDLSAIYTLGISTGTVIRNNLMHHIWDHPEGYLACGIYPDEGSSGLLIENNVAYQVTTGGLHVHFGRDNVVRNNIFAFGRFMQVFLGRGKGAGNEEAHKWLDNTTSSLTFDHNIVLYNRGGLFGRDCELVADHNLYWNMAAPVEFKPGVDLAQWQTKGRDAHSLVADPLFVDPLRGDFRLQPESPALTLGFKPIDLSVIGLVGEASWTAKPRQIKRADVVFPERTVLNRAD